MDYALTARNRRRVQAVFGYVGWIFLTAAMASAMWLIVSISRHGDDIGRNVMSVVWALVGAAYAGMMSMRASDMAERWEARARGEPW